MENKLLNHKRERNPSLENDQDDIDSLNNPRKEKKVENINLSKTDSILKESEQPEEDISELVFKLNCKTSGVECFLCQKDISKNIKFLCAECGNKVFCIKCLIQKKHPPQHQFQVVDILNYSFFTDDWSVCQEYNLLQNLSVSGLNNWEDISNILGRGQLNVNPIIILFITKKKKIPCQEKKILF